MKAKSKAKEPVTEIKNRIPLCYKCLCVITEDCEYRMDGKTFMSKKIVGCKRLTEKQWKRGWTRNKPSKGKPSYQKNCPIFKKLKEEA